MRNHPGSGAFREKADMSSREIIVELKDAGKSFRITLDDLKKLWRASLIAGQDPQFWIYFDDGSWVLKCHLEKLK